MALSDCIIETATDGTKAADMQESFLAEFGSKK